MRAPVPGGPAPGGSALAVAGATGSARAGYGELGSVFLNGSLCPRLSTLVFFGRLNAAADIVRAPKPGDARAGELAVNELDERVYGEVALALRPRGYSGGVRYGVSIPLACPNRDSCSGRAIVGGIGGAPPP